LQDLTWKKNPTQKKAAGVAQGIGLEFKPQYYRKSGGGERERVKAHICNPSYS
jgi:hypothetical protein